MRDKIASLVREYFRTQVHSVPEPREGYLPVAGKVIDEEDLAMLVDSCLDMHFTSGRFAHQFEKDFYRCSDVRFCCLVNSGSSANLVALSSLSSPILRERRITPGDEIITVGAGFPTTVNPIIQNQWVPVFIDVKLGTYQADCSLLDEALSNRTKAVIFAHTLGNTFDLKKTKHFCERHNLWLIEDCCDSLGAEYQGQKVGTFGDIATVSFYPAHQITMGEGGAVLTKSARLKRIIESFRDWGRDCWCEPGKDNTCGKRFEWDLGDMPKGYDHKYIYSHVGYNLKLTDMQAALGLSQLNKLETFVKKRRYNFNLLNSHLRGLEEFIVLPEETPLAKASWFGFPITLKMPISGKRTQLVRFLEENGIGTRNIFAGNLTRQPAYRDVKFRVIGCLTNCDRVMVDSFWVGVYPGLEDRHIQYISEKIYEGVELAKTSE
ncbi:MAG: lipopolysaccharide biosynthesis protein RfbH [Deltaproteobacteria bacterium]|nr:lipopolysaccharide biosynthesis protein RfbH [Deltaproteobacteria bacterium]